MSTATKKRSSATQLRSAAIAALRAGRKHADAYHQSRHDNSDASYTSLAADYDEKADRTRSPAWRTRYAKNAAKYRSYVGIHIDERCRWAYPAVRNTIEFEDPTGVGTYDNVMLNAFDSAGVPVARVEVTGSLDMITTIARAVQEIVARYPSPAERVVVYPGAFPKRR